MPEFEVELSKPINIDTFSEPDEDEEPRRVEPPEDEIDLSLVGMRSILDGRASCWKHPLIIRASLPTPFSPMTITGIAYGIGRNNLELRTFTAALKGITLRDSLLAQAITLVFPLRKFHFKPISFHALHFDNKLVKGEAAIGPYISNVLGSGRWEIKHHVP